MISIKKFLNRRPVDDLSSALRRTATLILEATAVHAIECETSELSRFQDSMRKSGRDLERMSSGQEVLVLAGTSINVIATYNREVELYIRTRRKQCEDMFSMFSKALIEVANAGEAAVGNLQAIEKDLHAYSQIEDLRDLKLRLATSLKALSEETIRQKHESETITRKMNDDIRAAQTFLEPSPAEMDAVTGLASHMCALRSLTGLIFSDKQCYIAAFCIERLDLINSRFGFTVGDQALGAFSKHLAKQLRPTDTLFRWRGPVVIAALERPEGTSEVQAELRRAAGVHLEHSFSTETRTVLLPISASWSLLRVQDFKSDRDLCEKLDAFVDQRRKLTT